MQRDRPLMRDGSEESKEAVSTAPTKVDPAICDTANTRLYQVTEGPIVAFENVLGYQFCGPSFGSVLATGDGTAV